MAYGKLSLTIMSRVPRQRNQKEAAKHFSWFGDFAATDNPSSNRRTREQLGWEPAMPGLLADLNGPGYLVTKQPGILVRNSQKPLSDPAPVMSNPRRRYNKGRGAGVLRLSPATRRRNETKDIPHTGGSLHPPHDLVTVIDSVGPNDPWQVAVRAEGDRNLRELRAVVDKAA